MKMVLDRAEMIAILEEHFDCAPGELRITIEVHPEFGATLDGIPLPKSAGGTREPPPVKVRTALMPTREYAADNDPGLPNADDDPSIAAGRSDADASTEIPPVSSDEGGAGPALGTAGMSPAALIAQSQMLKAGLDRDNPNLVAQGNRLRGAGGGGLRGTTKTPGYSDDEKG